MKHVNIVLVLTLFAYMLTVCTAQSVEGTLSEADAQLVEGTLSEADAQLDALTTRVVRLSNQLDGLLDVQSQSVLSVGRMDKQLDRLQDTNGGCSRGFYPCSSGAAGSVQCVRDYLVCDGSADCSNAADERTDVCENPFKEPVTLAIVSSVDTCASFSLADDTVQYMHFNPASVISWFPSRPQLTWRYDFSYALPTSTGTGTIPIISGVYDYATKDYIPDATSGLLLRGWRDIISPSKYIYRLEGRRPHSTKDELCYSGVAVLHSV